MERKYNFTICRWHDFIYLENPKDSSRKKILEIINNYSTIAGWKNQYKNLLHFLRSGVSLFLIFSLFLAGIIVSIYTDTFVPLGELVEFRKCPHLEWQERGGPSKDCYLLRELSKVLLSLGRYELLMKCWAEGQGLCWSHPQHISEPGTARSVVDPPSFTQMQKYKTLPLADFPFLPEELRFQGQPTTQSGALLHFYILTRNYQKAKWGKQSQL